MKKILTIAIMLAIMILAGCSSSPGNTTGNAVADLNDDPEKVTVYFFWGDGCPHCAEEKPFLEELEQKYPDLEVKMFETYQNPENRELMQTVAQAYGTEVQGIPTTFIGEEHWVGYSDNAGRQMEEKIKDCLENDCVNPGDKLN